MNRFVLGLTLFFFSGAAVVVADETNPPENAVETTITAKNRNIYDSDVEAQTGEIGINRSELRADFDTKIAGKLPFIFAIGGTHTEIDSSIPTELPNQLQSWTVRLGAKFPAPFIDADNMFMGVDVFPSQFSDNLERSDSGTFRIPFRAYLIYKESDDFILVAGALIRPDYDDKVLPVVGFKWQASEDLLFNFVTDDPHISLKLCPKADALVEFNFISEEYEVSRGNDRNVVLKYDETSTGLGLRYHFTENIQAVVSGGVVFGRQLRYEDDQGKVDPDAGAYSNIKVEIKF